MRIPEPNLWWIIILALTVFWFGIGKLAHGVAHGATLPYYAGKPPPSGHYKGRCWCVLHGPRGGCIHWSCPKPKAEGDEVDEL